MKAIFKIWSEAEVGALRPLAQKFVTSKKRDIVHAMSVSPPDMPDDDDYTLIVSVGPGSQRNDREVNEQEYIADMSADFEAWVKHPQRSLPVRFVPSFYPNVTQS